MKFERKLEHFRFVNPFLGWLIIFMSSTGKLPTIDSYFSMNVGIAILMIATVSKEGKSGARNIANKVFALFGKLSYGLFLCHIFIFWYLSVPILNSFNIVDSFHRFLLGTFIALPTSLALSWISYNTIEKYFQRCTANRLFLGNLSLLFICSFLGFLV